VAQPELATPEETAAQQAVAEEQFREAVMEVENAFQSGDVDRIIEYYAEDAISMPPGFPTSIGREAIEADLRFFFDEFTMDREFTLVDVDMRGDYATRRGEWTQILTPKASGEPIVEVGRCVLGFKKVNDEWKVAWEIWNTYEPATTGPAANMAPEVAVMFYTSEGAHERFGMIDLDTGAGTDVGPYMNPEVNILRTEWAAANGAIYDGAYYTILNKRLPSDATPAAAEARLARVDIQTGEAELLGSIIPLNLMGNEINYCGEMFATGFTLSNQLGEWFGDTNLYRVNREDGSLTLIGDTGVERIMDLSFDPEGTLWATVGNVLYTLDLETGAATEMAQITGVEADNEIMGIGFTSEGVLYATTPFSDGFYTIDPATGVVTEIGRHGFTIPHGGDVPMVPHDVSCEGVSE
jgi:ketosteroid isomerase-like protein